MHVSVAKVASIPPATLEAPNVRKLEQTNVSNLLFSNLPKSSIDAIVERFDRDFSAVKSYVYHLEDK